MKQRILLALLAVALIPAAAGAVGIGAGAYIGTSTPVLNEPANSGVIYGVRAPILLAPMLSVEPFYAQSALGDVEDSFGGQTYTRSGPDVKTFGANAIFSFGEGVKFYPLVGIGSTKIEQTGAEDITDTSLNFGLGLGIPFMGRFMADIRAELNSVITGDTSRKFGNFTGGVSYALFE
jgi:opacity protein-like surface antigen